MQNEKQSWLSKLFKKKKKKPENLVSLYVIYHCPQAKYKACKGTMVPVYYTDTQENALRAVSKMLFQQHYSHFCSWVDFHPDELKSVGITVGDQNNYTYASAAWILYSALVLEDPHHEVNESDLYTVVEMQYNATEVSIFLRMLTACQPLNIKGEKEEEIANFNMVHYTDSKVECDGVKINQVFIPLVNSDAAFKEKILRNSQIIEEVIKDSQEQK